MPVAYLPCYGGDMARPTQLAARLAEQLGETPSRVQSWIERGYGPAGDADPVEHFRRLAPLMGEGRTGDVAVLKMAADGWPCRRLRDVLRSVAEPRPDEEALDDPDELVDAVMSDPSLPGRTMMLADAPSEPPVEWCAPRDTPELPPTEEELAEAKAREKELHGTKELASLPEHLAQRSVTGLDEPAIADLLTRSAFLPVADVVTGRDVEPEDLNDLNRFGPWYRLGMPRPPMPETDELAQELATVRAAAAAVLGSRGWVEKATPSELAAGVAAARSLVDALAALHPLARSLGDEERWRLVGSLAPSAPAVLGMVQSMVALLDGPGHGYPHIPEIDALLAVVRRSRTMPASDTLSAGEEASPDVD